MRICRTLLLCLPVLCSVAVHAQCSNPGKFQTITIQPDNTGQPVADNKGPADQCIVMNNKHPDLQITSHIKWVFKDLNCTKTRCRIEILNQPPLSQNAYDCQPDRPKYFVCTLKVNEAKTLCPGNTHPNSDCTVQYVIRVGDLTIDPSIIIRPRPAV